MTEEQPKKVESESASNPTPEPVIVHHEAPKHVSEEKPVIVDIGDIIGNSRSVEDIIGNNRSPSEAGVEKPSERSVNRDAVLERVATEKRLSLIKAWEESEKSKAENKAYKELAEISAWEKTKKANTEAELKKIEEQLEKKKAEYAEKLKNKIATIHKEAEEKRATIEAKKGEDLLKAEELAAKYRATGTEPKKLLGCF
ncbi:unnamed protein product [Lupinus luteus]|uniref:Remorin C-terminal domain-containing protein n=1 Tax=Lupinus luteus TaxID=3873 RepID=A0AAV1X4H6_LUPLU